MLNVMFKPLNVSAGPTSVSVVPAVRLGVRVKICVAQPQPRLCPDHIALICLPTQQRVNREGEPGLHLGHGAAGGHH